MALWGWALLMTMAQAQVTCSAIASPQTLVIPGPVSVTLNIANDAEQAVQISYLKDGIKETLGSLPGGETLTHRRTIAVTNAQLNAGKVLLTLLIESESGSESYAVPVAVTRVKAQPELQVRRHASAQVIHTGDEVTLCYEIFNTGNVPLSNIVLTDELGQYSKSINQLAVGETQTFLQKATLWADATSRPTVSYTDSSTGQVDRKDLEPLTLYVAEDQVRVEVYDAPASIARGTRAALTVKVDNVGRLSYSDGVLMEPLLGRVPELPAYLAANTAITLTVDTALLWEDTTYCFTWNACDEQGRTVQVRSEPITICLHSAEPVTVSNAVTDESVLPVTTAYPVDPIDEPSPSRICPPGVLVGVGLLVVAVGGYRWWRMKKRKLKRRGRAPTRMNAPGMPAPLPHYKSKESARGAVADSVNEHPSV